MKKLKIILLYIISVPLALIYALLTCFEDTKQVKIPGQEDDTEVNYSKLNSK